MALSPQEILVIGLIILLLFGATAIPKLARSLGRAQGEFQKAKSEFSSEMKAGEAEASGASEDQIRKTARELGIEEDGLDLDEVKRAINEKLA